MAGIKFGTVRLKLPCGIRKTAVKRKLWIVEATHENVGGKPARDIKDPLVRATADQNLLSFFFYQKILLVAEVIGNKCAARLFIKSRRNKSVTPFPAVAAEQLKLTVDYMLIWSKHDTSTVLKVRVKSDIFLSTVVMR